MLFVLKRILRIPSQKKPSSFAIQGTLNGRIILLLAKWTTQQKKNKNFKQAKNETTNYANKYILFAELIKKIRTNI